MPSPDKRTPTPVERMIVAASHLVEDDAVLMVGTQWPIIVSLLARATHAPGAVICYEGGIVLQDMPGRIPLFTADPVVQSCAAFLGESLDTLGMVLHGGRCRMALLSAASVDRFGNINTTCIGPYGSPTLRFGGSGGACDFGSLSPRTVIVMEHDRRRFPERVDFITTPGYLDGGGERYRAGLRPRTGPYAVVTTLGLFRFNEAGEMILSGFHEGTDVEEIRGQVQWDLKVADDVGPLPSPTPLELDTLRGLDPERMYLEYKRLLEGKEISL